MLSCAGQATASRRIYFAGYAGLNIFPEQKITDSVLNVTGDIGMEEGHNFAGAIGFKLTPQLRLEGEINFLSADMDAIRLSGLGSFDITGGIDAKIAMLNLYYDFNMDWMRFRPFVGGGVGYAWYDGTVDNFLGLPTDITESGSGYVWQVGGGVRYPLSRSVAMIGAYRYMDGQDLELGRYDIDFGTHEFRLGLSWDLPFDY